MNSQVNFTWPALVKLPYHPLLPPFLLGITGPSPASTSSSSLFVVIRIFECSKLESLKAVTSSQQKILITHCIASQLSKGLYDVAPTCSHDSIPHTSSVRTRYHHHATRFSVFFCFSHVKRKRNVAIQILYVYFILFFIPLFVQPFLAPHCTACLLTCSRARPSSESLSFSVVRSRFRFILYFSLAALSYPRNIHPAIRHLFLFALLLRYESTV